MDGFAYFGRKLDTAKFFFLILYWSLNSSAGRRSGKRSNVNETSCNEIHHRKVSKLILNIFNPEMTMIIEFPSIFRGAHVEE